MVHSRVSAVRWASALLALATLTCTIQLAGAERADALGQLGFADCFSNSGSQGLCAAVPGGGTPLTGASVVAVSPDGNSVYTGGFEATAITVFSRAPGGKLTYVECINDDGSGGCVDLPGPATQLSGLSALAVSQDGNSVYATGEFADAVSVFGRAPGGQLTYAGCVSNTGSGGLCGDVPGAGTPLSGSRTLVVSPDGNSLYVGGQTADTVTAFSRAAGGQITYAGCFSDDGSGGLCGDVPGTATPLNGVRDLAISPDGNSLYAADAIANTVAVFKRASPEGQLTYAECFSSDGSNGCIDVPGTGAPLSGPNSIAVSGDGDSVYVGGAPNTPFVASSVAVFKRASPEGQLTYSECFSDDGSNDCNDLPGTGARLKGLDAIAVSPDSSSVYVGAANSDTLTVFRRTGPEGRLSYGECLSNDGTGGLCAVVPGTLLTAPAAIAVSPDNSSVYLGAFNPGTIVHLTRQTALLQTTIDSGPSEGASSAERQPRFAFSANLPGAGFECAIDGGAFGPCVSPIAIGPLAQGAHSFSVRAIAGGEVDPTPASRGFSVADTTAPTVKLTKAPRHKLASRKRKVKVSFSFTSNEAGSRFLCKLDRKRFTRCGSPKTYRVRRGRHRFAVEAVDAAGNASAPASISFRVTAKGRKRS